MSQLYYTNHFFGFEVEQKIASQAK